MKDEPRRQGDRSLGTSDISIEDAINGAIDRAVETVENLQWFQVIETRGSIAGQKVERYQVILKVAFGLMSAKS